MKKEFYEEDEHLSRRELIKLESKTKLMNFCKKIIGLVLSVAFICLVFNIVINAAIDNINNKSPINYDNLNQDYNNQDNNIQDEQVISQRKEDFITILIGVTDEDELRTDALILCAFDVKNEKISLLNIPRDTYADATKQSKKINSAYVLGINHTKDMVSKLVGFMPDKYIVMNFSGIEEIIDILGGVTVDVPFNMKYDDPEQDLHINIKSGTQTLDGKNAVHFLRWRKNNNGTGYATGDIGRIENTQEFINTLKEQCLSLKTVLKLPEIANTVFENIQTDFKLDEILWFITNASSNLTIDSKMLDGQADYIGGVSYYIPSENEILNTINESFNPFNYEITSIDLYNE